ncbi:MAG: MBL fold metallo-hydrolase [Desulfitobacterium sp.]
MKKLIVLGTGHAAVTHCYNTCFALTDENEYILVDAGGGNGILTQLEKAGVPIQKIHHAFVSHRHTDHLLGMVWIIRIIGSLILADRYQGNLKIYCHDELVENIKSLAEITLDKKLNELLGERILLITVGDGQEQSLMGYSFTFFDLHSAKAKQFGFTVNLCEGKKLTFLGDEPYHPSCESYANDCDWLLCEAFCLYEERDIFKPYDKHHSTVKDSCELATQLDVKNLVLWHSEDKTLPKRKELYTNEGKQYFKGNLFVPKDLDVIEL